LFILLADLHPLVLIFFFVDFQNFFITFFEFSFIFGMNRNIYSISKIFARFSDIFKYFMVLGIFWLLALN